MTSKSSFGQERCAIILTANKRACEQILTILARIEIRVHFSIHHLPSGLFNLQRSTMAFDWSLKHTPRPWSLAHIKQGFQLAGPMTNDEWVLVRQAMTAHLKKSDLLSIYFIAKEPRAQLTASIDEFQQSWPILLSLPRPYKSWAKMAIRYLAVHCTQNHHRLEKKAEGEKNNDSDSVTSRRSQSSAPTNPSTFSSSEAMRTADISHLSTYSSIGKVVAAPRAFQIQDRDNDQHTASFPIEDALTPQDQRDHAAPLHWTHLSFETFLASVQEQVPHLQQLRIFCAGISIQNQKSFQTQCMLQWGDTEIKFDMCGTADYGKRFAKLYCRSMLKGPSDFIPGGLKTWAES